MINIIISSAVFLFGAIIGSFLNVCIVRIPQDTSVVAPRSHCPHCRKQIPWYDNIPLLSILVLRAQCRFCHQRISFRYFIVEALTGFLFLFFYFVFGADIILIPYAVMVSGLIIATFIDFEHRIIPDRISVGGMCAGLLFSLLIPSLHGVDIAGIGFFKGHVLSFWRSVLGVLIGGGTIYLMGVLGDVLFKKESMGGGDIKLMAMIGAFLGWKLALLTFFVAPFFGAIYGIIEKIRIKESAIAYGPFLALAAIISIFWGEMIIGMILAGYGF